MKKAVIDIGSNTINLLIGEVSKNGELRVYHDEKNHAKLAKGGINNKTITPEAFNRGLNAIEHYVHLCRMHKVPEKNIFSYATATIRGTNNGLEFTNTLSKKFGIETQIIDGETEAELIYEGVKNGMPKLNNSFLVLDIGGGSVEFILANNQGILWKRSFELGVSRLLDKFKPTDPISKEDVSKIEMHINDELADFNNALKFWKINTLVGSSGSFDTLRSILQAKKQVTDNQESFLRMELADLEILFNDFIKLDIKERLAIKGMDLMRAEYMPIAAILIRIVLSKANINEVFQCSYALKEGAFFQ